MISTKCELLTNGLPIARATTRAHMVISVGHIETQTQAKAKVTTGHNAVEKKCRGCDVSHNHTKYTSIPPLGYCKNTMVNNLQPTLEIDTLTLPIVCHQPGVYIRLLLQGSFKMYFNRIPKIDDGMGNCSRNRHER